MKPSGPPEEQPAQQASVMTDPADESANLVLRLLIFLKGFVCTQAFLQVPSLHAGADSPADGTLSPGQLQQRGTWHKGAHLVALRRRSGCVPAMLAPSDWQIQLLPLLLNNMGLETLPARWVVPGNRGDSHWAQEKREKLCKMITIVLSI